jgi:ribose 5-phosphate isomerase B
MIKIALVLCADHRGFNLKQQIVQNALYGDYEISWHDEGAFTAQRSDYPYYAHRAINTMIDKHINGAVMLCGSGTGMAIVANRYKNIYAAVAWNEDIARIAKEDDNCNVLVLPADYIDARTAHACIEKWLNASFKQGHYQERLETIDKK